MRKVFAIVFYYLIIFLVPVCFMLTYSDSSSDLLDYFKTLVYWGAILAILVLFKDKISIFIENLFKKGGRATFPGGFEVEFNSQEDLASLDNKTEDDTDIEKIRKELGNESSWAWLYYIKFIAITIYALSFNF